MAPAPPTRHVSVDTLRGLTIMLMVFGWHLSSSDHSPAIWEHLEPPDGEGMTVADGVFPAFLFIVGMSVPLAQAAARAKGLVGGDILRQTFTRTLSLLAAGVLLVNASFEATGWPPRLWVTLVLLGIVFAWSRVPREGQPGRRRAQVMRVVGGVTLVTCAAFFRREDGTWLRPEWWGIFGVIGWCYLAVSALVVATRGKRLALGALTFLCIGLFAATREQLIPRALGTAGGFMDVGSVFGSHTAVALAGATLGSLLGGPTADPSAARRARFTFLWILLLVGVGAALDPVYGVNKLRATPSWALFSSAITASVWLVLVYVMDVRGHTRWARRIEPVGQNPLAAYLFYQAVLNLLQLLGRTEPFTFANLGLWQGVAAALFFVALVVTLTTFARKHGPWPRL